MVARVVLALSLAGSSSLTAQDVVGTLLVAHGGSEAWNADVRAVAREVRTGGPVAVSFLMGAGAPTSRFQDQVAALRAAGATRVAVVPLLVSSHSGHYEQIRWLAGQVDSLDAAMAAHLQHAGIERALDAVPLVVTRALDDAPELGRILVDRARALLAGDSAGAHALFLVGHGPNSPEDHAKWMMGLRTLAEHVRDVVGFRDARAGVVRDDAAPAVRAEAVRAVHDVVALQAAATGTEVLVLPLAIAAGRFTDRTLRADLAGLPVRYDGQPILPHADVARWVERRVAETARTALSPRE